MSVCLLYLAYVVMFLLASTAIFFFTLTRGALILRRILGGNQAESAHIYPIYSHMGLIRFVDFQPVIAAILLFQYDRLVSIITAGIAKTDLTHKQVLITSCAFGNVIPRVVAAAVKAGVEKVLIADLITNELINAQDKVVAFADKTVFLKDDATAMHQPTNSVDANVIFFLLHELPHHLKVQALSEAGRVLKSGGKLYLAEFHRPDNVLLRGLSYVYFKVFEPWGLALWSTHDPVKQLNEIGGFTCERHTLLLGNFQVIIATKH